MLGGDEGSFVDLGRCTQVRINLGWCSVPECEPLTNFDTCNYAEGRAWDAAAWSPTLARRRSYDCTGQPSPRQPGVFPQLMPFAKMPFALILLH